jgi:CheY-like chemotaxis protein
VDDNQTNRRILDLQCKNWGLVPYSVSSGKEALDLISKQIHFDIGLIDMSMPGMDGVQLAKLIKSTLKEANFPLVMISSIGRNLETQTLPLDLFTVYLNKPIKQSVLFNSIIQSLSDNHLTTQPQRDPTPAELDDQLSEKYPLRILVAEDNPVNQKLAQRILQKMGYKPDLVANGIEVIEALRRQQYDLILMDVQMPEMDGLDATREIIREFGEESRPRIIAMTANAMRGDREVCLSAGMDDYISKPIRLVELQEILIRWGNTLIDQTPRQPSTTYIAPPEMVDLETIQQLRSLGVGPYMELVKMYLAESFLTIQRIHTARQEDDFASIVLLAHNLNGSSINMGLVQIASVASNLEAVTPKTDREYLDSLLNDLDYHFEQAAHELHEEMNQSGEFPPSITFN